MFQRSYFEQIWGASPDRDGNNDYPSPLPPKNKERSRQQRTLSTNESMQGQTYGERNVVHIAEEDRQRAQFYRLLAHLLVDVPQEKTLAVVASFEGDESPLGQATGALAAVARSISQKQADDEYHDLFIGVGRGELMPYGSYYLTGFLNEKPLARLRQDMARLGIERSADAHDPEDHIASVCEIMAGLIEGNFDEPASLAEQAEFFDRHIAPWARHFFSDLEKTKTGLLYRHVGTLGRVFMDIETTAFELAA